MQQVWCLKSKKINLKYTTVNSSKIGKIGFDKIRQLMEIHLKNGHIYLHKHVPPKFYMECMAASSIGKYYYENIKEVFPYEILQ